MNLSSTHVIRGFKTALAAESGKALVGLVKNESLPATYNLKKMISARISWQEWKAFDRLLFFN